MRSTREAGGAARILRAARLGRERWGRSPRGCVFLFGAVDMRSRRLLFARLDVRLGVDALVVDRGSIPAGGLPAQRVVFEVCLSLKSFRK
jgi:hypothetical protein